MTQLLPGIRNAVRALIVHEEHVLLLRKCHGDNDEYYALPGGAQEEGESLVDALQRECEEEIGSTISIGELLLVADYTKQRRSDPPSRRQLVEFLFRCGLPAGYHPHNGPKPDKHQQAVVWVDRQRVASLRLVPGFLKPIVSIAQPGGSAYAGAFSDHVDTA